MPGRHYIVPKSIIEKVQNQSDEQNTKPDEHGPYQTLVCLSILGGLLMILSLTLFTMSEPAFIYADGEGYVTDNTDCSVACIGAGTGTIACYSEGTISIQYDTDNTANIIANVQSIDVNCSDYCCDAELNENILLYIYVTEDSIEAHSQSFMFEPDLYFSVAVLFASICFFSLCASLILLFSIDRSSPITK